MHAKGRERETTHLGIRFPIISLLTGARSEGVPNPCPKLPLGKSGDAPGTSYFAIRDLTDPPTGTFRLLLLAEEEGEEVDCLLSRARRSARDMLLEDEGRTGGALEGRLSSVRGLSAYLLPEKVGAVLRLT